jgi:fatty-acid desaturase
MRSTSFALFALAYYQLAGLGVNLGYHRVLSHRSLRLPLWLERALVTLGLPAGTPIQWAGNHRFHHRHSDTALDPHSPVHQGFWYAHVGWYLGSRSVPLSVMYALAGPVRMLIDAWMRPRTNQQHNALAPDVAADRWYGCLSRPWPYAVAMHVHAAIPVTLAWWFWGGAGIAGLWVVLVVLYNLADAIDSVSHLYGTTLPGQRNASRNGLVMGLLTLGEGWHANHHRFPWSARHGLLRGQWDWTWQIIRALRAAGVAHDVRLPRDAPNHAIIGGPPPCK